MANQDVNLILKIDNGQALGSVRAVDGAIEVLKNSSSNVAIFDQFGKPLEQAQKIISQTRGGIDALTNAREGLAGAIRNETQSTNTNTGAQARGAAAHRQGKAVIEDETRATDQLGQAKNRATQLTFAFGQTIQDASYGIQFAVNNVGTLIQFYELFKAEVQAVAVAQTAQTATTATQTIAESAQSTVLATNTTQTSANAGATTVLSGANVSAAATTGTFSVAMRTLGSVLAGPTGIFLLVNVAGALYQIFKDSFSAKKGTEEFKDSLKDTVPITYGISRGYLTIEDALKRIEQQSIKTQIELQNASGAALYSVYQVQKATTDGARFAVQKAENDLLSARNKKKAVVRAGPTGAVVTLEQDTEAIQLAEKELENAKKSLVIAQRISEEAFRRVNSDLGARAARAGALAQRLASQRNISREQQAEINQLLAQERSLNTILDQRLGRGDYDPETIARNNQKSELKAKREAEKAERERLREERKRERLADKAESEAERLAQEREAASDRNRLRDFEGVQKEFIELQIQLREELQESARLGGKYRQDALDYYGLDEQTAQRIANSIEPLSDSFDGLLDIQSKIQSSGKTVSGAFKKLLDDTLDEIREYNRKAEKEAKALIIPIIPSDFAEAYKRQIENRVVKSTDTLRDIKPLDIAIPVTPVLAVSGISAFTNSLTEFIEGDLYAGITAVTSGVFDLSNSFTDLANTRRENLASVLEKETETYNKSLDLEEKRLLKGAFTERQRDQISADIAEKKRLREEENAKKLAAVGLRAFRFEQATGIANATVNTFEGATRALADYPFPFSAIVAGLTIASGVAQIANITNTKPPQYATGSPGASGFVEVGELGPEMILTAQATKRLSPYFNELNQGKLPTVGVPSAGQPTNLNINVSYDPYETEVITSMGNKRLKRANL